MRNFLTAVIFLSTASFSYAQSHMPVCDSASACYDKASWVADGEVYNIHIHQSDKKQGDIVEFDFAIESWVKGEMKYGHFLHFITTANGTSLQDLNNGRDGWYRFYGTDNKNEILYAEKLND